MTGNNHRPNCANAQNPGCVCSGCGGALHGWQGWTDLADDTQQRRDDRRHRIEGKIERNRRTGALSFNARNRQAFVDLARLDITDYLSATSTESLRPGTDHHRVGILPIRQRTRPTRTGKTAAGSIPATRATSWLAGKFHVGFRGVTRTRAKNGARWYHRGNRHWRSSARKGNGSSSNLEFHQPGHHRYTNFHIVHRSPRRWAPWW